MAAFAYPIIYTCWYIQCVGQVLFALPVLNNSIIISAVVVNNSGHNFAITSKYLAQSWTCSSSVYEFYSVFSSPLSFGFVYPCTAVGFIALNSALKSSYESGCLMLCCGSIAGRTAGEWTWNETVRWVPAWGANQWNWTRICALRGWEESKTRKETGSCGWQGAAWQGDCWGGMKRSNQYQLKSGKWSLGSCTQQEKGFWRTRQGCDGAALGVWIVHWSSWSKDEKLKYSFFRNIHSSVSVTETKILSCSHSFITNNGLQNLLTVSLKPSYALDMIYSCCQVQCKLKEEKPSGFQK